jgi:hypothetical protein
MRPETKFFVLGFLMIALIAAATLFVAKNFYEFVAAAAYFVEFVFLVYLADKHVLHSVDTAEMLAREKSSNLLMSGLSYHKIFLMGYFALAVACILKA